MLTKTRTRWIIFVLYIGAVIISYHFSDIKYRSLNFHTRDYAFYLQFASKLLDGDITKSYSINPNGHNWLFFHGTEGINDFQKTIHFEPIKYIYAVIYYFSGTPRTLFLFTSLIFFLPLIYLSFAIPMDTKQQMHFVLSIAILYVLYPSSLHLPSFDLRPFVFLPPFFLLSMLSITFSRPIWEILLWFNAMFLAREEALILGMVLLCYALVKIKKPSLRHKTIMSLFLSFLFWALVTFSFLVWCRYPTELNQMLAKIGKTYAGEPITLFATSLGGITILATMIFCWRQLRNKAYYQRTLEIISFSTVFLPLGYHFLRKELPNIVSPSLFWIANVVLARRYYLYFVALLCLGIILLPYIKKNIGSSTARLILISSLSLLLLSVNIIAPQGMHQLYAKYNDDLKSASDVWNLRDLTDKSLNWILVDYSTHQAFYDYQYAYAYNRLPWQVIAGTSRYYPANRAILQGIVNEHIEYAVISKDSHGIVEDCLSNGGLTGVKLFENSKFIAIQINERIDTRLTPAARSMLLP